VTVSALIVERVVGAALFLTGASGCGIAGSVVLGDMVEDINRRAPLHEQESPLSWYFLKLQRVRRRYRALYPEGKRLKTLNGLMIIGPILVLIGGGLMLGLEFFGL
jgi:hypothetical protein